MKMVPLHEWHNVELVGEHHVPSRIQAAIENDHLCAIFIHDDQPPPPPPQYHDTPSTSLRHHFVDTGIGVWDQLRAG